MKVKEELSILVLDGSGSMSHDDASGLKRAEAVEQAVKELMEEINRSAVAEERFVAIIGYDHRAEVILDPTCVIDLRTDDSEVMVPLLDLPPLNLLSKFGGSTAIGTALRSAQDMAETWLQDEDPNVPRYVTIILLTDGYEEEGTEPEKVAEQINEEYKTLKGSISRPSIVIATVAYGKDPQLQQYHDALDKMATTWKPGKQERHYFGVAVDGKQLKRWLTATIIHRRG